MKAYNLRILLVTGLFLFLFQPIMSMSEENIRYYDIELVVFESLEEAMDNNEICLRPSNWKYLKIRPFWDENLRVNCPRNTTQACCLTPCWSRITSSKRKSKASMNRNNTVCCCILAGVNQAYPKNKR